MRSNCRMPIKLADFRIRCNNRYIKVFYIDELQADVFSRFFSSRWQGIGLNKGLRLRPNFLRQVQLPRVAKYFYIRFRGVNHGHATSMVDATSILKTANVEVKKKKKRSVEATNVEIIEY